MGLNVGGLHVRVHANVNSKKVAEQIETYWLSLGATRSKSDALENKPMSLEKTGRLGFLVLPVLNSEEAEHEHQWVPVYDSERYRSDPALARHLAQELETLVWYWDVSDASSQAYAKCYGGQEEALSGESVLDLLDMLPGSAIYFNLVRETIPPDALEGCTLLSFEQIPHRPNARYSGPSAAQLQSNDAAAMAAELVGQFDTEGLQELADDRQVFFDVIEPAVKCANLHVPKQLEFVYALGPTVLRYRKHSEEVAEAALRGSDEELFAQATQSIASYQANLLEARAFELGKAGENEIAFRLLEAITRQSSASQTVWTNALYFLQFVDPSCLPSPRLEQLLERARDAGRTNSAVFRNLASVLLTLERVDDAVEAVRAAKLHGYQNMDAIKEDLGEYARDPRFLEALNASTEDGLDGIRIERGYKRGSLCLVKAGVGLHFLLESESAPRVADLLEFLREHYPEMFGYYRPSGQLVMLPTKKGKVSRDISALRKNNSKYGFDIQYDDSKGQAPDHRFVFDDMNDEGELSVYLPLSTADDHDQLFERAIQIAQMLPFRSGCVGYTLAPFHEGDAVGPGSDARRELARLAPELPGLGLQSSKGGKIAEGIMGPSWVTLLGSALLEALASDFRTSLEDASVHELEGGGVAIRASNAPMVGRGQNPTDLAALPQVVQALAPLWAESKLTEVQAARLQGISRA